MQIQGLECFTGRVVKGKSRRAPRTGCAGTSTACDFDLGKVKAEARARSKCLVQGFLGRPSRCKERCWGWTRRGPFKLLEAEDFGGSERAPQKPGPPTGQEVPDARNVRDVYADAEHLISAGGPLPKAELTFKGGSPKAYKGCVGADDNVVPSTGREAHAGGGFHWARCSSTIMGFHWQFGLCIARQVGSPCIREHDR